SADACGRIPMKRSADDGYVSADIRMGSQIDGAADSDDVAVHLTVDRGAPSDGDNVPVDDLIGSNVHASPDSDAIRTTVWRAPRAVPIDLISRLRRSRVSRTPPWAGSPSNRCAICRPSV